MGGFGDFRHRISLIFFFVFLGPTGIGEEEILSVKFKSQHTPNNFIFPRELKRFEEKFSKAVGFMPEPLLASSVLSMGGEHFGIEKKQVSLLSHRLMKVYSELATSKHASLESILPLSISNPQRQGHYFLHIPNSRTSKTILFLHGYGGNPKMYVWLLAKHFPNFNIIVPSSGVSWASSSNYLLREVLSDAKKKVSFDGLILMALSQGGPAGFRFQSRYGKEVIAFFPIATAPADLDHNLVKHIFPLNGTLDRRFEIKYVRRLYERLEKRSLSPTEIKSDHFFLLTEEKETFRFLKEKISTVLE